MFSIFQSLFKSIPTKAVIKCFKPELQKITLPPHMYWNGEGLYCRVCFPSHTIPMFYAANMCNLLEDSNIKSFMKTHENCGEINCE